MRRGRVLGYMFGRPVWGLLVLLALAASTPAAEAQDLLDRAFELHGAGRLREALAAYVKYGAQAGVDVLDRGLALSNACAIELDLGEYAGALANCARALEDLRDSGEEDLLSQALNNSALAHQRLGDLDEAGQQFEQALAINTGLDLPEAMAVNIANLGALATVRGRPGDALAYYDRLEILARRHATAEWAGHQREIAAINRGVVLEQIGEYRQALTTYRELLESGPPVEPRDHAAVLVNIATIYRNLGDPLTASRYLERAYALYVRVGDRGGAGGVLLNRGIVRHLNLDDPIGARADYSAALQLSRATGDRLTEVEAMVYLGRLAAEAGSGEEAIERLTAARELAARNQFGEGEWWANIALGAALVELEPEQGAAVTMQALTRVEDAASGLGGRPERSAFAAGRRGLFEVAVETLVRAAALRPHSGYALQALRVAQMAKAWALTQRLKVPISVRPLPVAAEHIAPDSAALEVLVTDRAAFAWLQSSADIAMGELGTGAEILQAAERVRDDLHSESGPATADLQFLSDRLLAPFANQLRQVRRLFLALDGPTSYIPIDMLPVPGHPELQVIDRWELTYVPVTAMLGRTSSPRPSGSAVFVGIVPGTESEGVRGPFHLPSLAHAEQEVLAARSRVGNGEILQGPEATESALGQALQRGARVIHLAAHSVMDDAQDRGGAVLLQPGDDGDGALFADEIAALEGHADLVVLAACSTAVTASGGMSSLASLTGSFLVAGADSVLASLWDVDDAASAAFMDQFYYELRRGRAPSAAVRAAKLRLRDHGYRGHPSAWAAYVLIGDAEPLFQLPHYRPSRSLSVALLLLAVGLLWAWVSARQRVRRIAG